MNRRVPSLAAVVIALSLQLAATAKLDSRHRTAVWIAAFGASLFVWMSTGKRLRVLLVVLCAIVLSIRIPARFRFGGGGDGGTVLDGGPYHDPGEPAASKTKSTTALVAGEAFPGVILFPEVEDHVTIVPPLPTMRSAVFKPGDRNPLDIPFFGSYHLFKFPHGALPKTAITLRGDPDRKTFHSTDHMAMRMEAHQNLGNFFDLSCCRAIEIAVRNADRYPGSIQVVLELRNTELKKTLSLGRMEITSTPRWTSATRESAFEILTYPIPPSPSLRRFDEFSVRFILGILRADHSAGVAIQRFTLVPHGWQAR